MTFKASLKADDIPTKRRFYVQVYGDVCPSVFALLSFGETVGVILPYSSAFTKIAEEQENAIRLALENTDIKLVFEDGGPETEGTIAAWKRLDSPDAVISCASWAATALNPLTAEANVPHIAIGSAIIDRKAEEHTVRFTLDAKMEERQLHKYLRRFDRLAILNMDNGYGNNWADVIEGKFGEKVIVSRAYDPMQDDFSKEIKAMKEADPDAIILLSAGKAALLAELIRKAGIDAQLVGTRPIERPELLEKAEYTEGLVYTYPSFDNEHPFLAEYRQRFGAEPTIFAVEAYEAALTLKEAMASGEEIFEWYSGRRLKGALGDITFDEKGDAHYPYMYKEIRKGAFVPALFQYDMLLEETREQIEATFHSMHQSLEDMEEHLHALRGDDVQKAIDNIMADNPYVYDCVTIDTDGKICAVSPADYSHLIGEDISSQPQIVKIHKTHKPVVSEAFKAVEGFWAFDLEHPLFDGDGNFVGSVSLLTKPDFFGQVIDGTVANFPVEIWMMQTDGRIIYDVNDEEIGLNLWTSEMYDGFENLREVGHRMAGERQGRDNYTFYDKELAQEVSKELHWTTVSLQGTEFRLALAYVK